MRPLVSVIIPSYNRAQLLPKALESVMAQTYPADRTEIIVVDDGSTDGTGQVMALAFPQVRYIYQTNGGVSSARNRGLREASGSVLTFLDSDDLWLPEKLAAQVAMLTNHPEIGMVVTDVLRRHTSGKEDRLRRRETIPVDGYALNTVIEHPALVPSSVAIRRAVYEELGGFDPTLRTAEDIDYMLRIARMYPIGVLEEALTVAARGLEDGLGAVHGTYQDYMFVLNRFFSDFANELPASMRHTALARARARFSRGLAGDGALGQAAQNLAKSAFHARNRDDISYTLRAGAAVIKAAARRAIPLGALGSLGKSR